MRERLAYPGSIVVTLPAAYAASLRMVGQSCRSMPRKCDRPWGYCRPTQTGGVSARAEIASEHQQGRVLTSSDVDASELRLKPIWFSSSRIIRTPLRARAVSHRVVFRSGEHKAWTDSLCASRWTTSFGRARKGRCSACSPGGRPRRGLAGRTKRCPRRGMFA
jgi:hypothetical protein